MYPLEPALIPLNNATDRLSSMAESVPVLAMSNIDSRIRRSIDTSTLSTTAYNNNMIIYPAYNESMLTKEDLADHDMVPHFLDNFDITSLHTTTQPSNITNATTTIMPTPVIYMISTAMDLKLLMLFPLGFFLLTSLIRKLRRIAPFSVIASVALAIGAVSVFTYMCIGKLLNL